MEAVALNPELLINGGIGLYLIIWTTKVVNKKLDDIATELRKLNNTP